MPLRIIIVGGGIAGLAAAVGLARQGHEVHVLERRSAAHRQQRSSGIQLQPNVSRILREWGMMDDVRRVAHDNGCATLRDQHGATIATSRFRGHAWYVLRSVVRNLFYEHAVRAGARVVEGVVMVEVDAARPAVRLEDGTWVEGDLLVGADGSGSRVRQTLFPDYRPQVLDKVCWQAALPLATVRDDAVMRSLLDGRHSTIILSPARSIYTSPVPAQDVYEFHLVEHDCPLAQDPDPGLLHGMVRDLTGLRRRFADHDPALRTALDRATRVLKWRFVEVTDVPSLVGPGGKVVLIGDACHSMMPFSGQGSAMGIEDAAVLSELLPPATTAGDDLAAIMDVFTRLRRPRFERVMDLARNMEAMWAITDPEMIEARNAALRAASHRDRSWTSVTPNADAPYGSPPFQVWLDDYDVFQAARTAIGKAKSPPAKL